MIPNFAELERKNGLPSGLLSAVMQQESGGNPNAISPKGALGAFQFMPATAKAYGINPMNPEEAAIGAARMYGDLSKQFNGDVPSMLAAYNWGSGNLSKKGIENAPPETLNYIRKIQSKLGNQYADSGQIANDAMPPLPAGYTLDEEPSTNFSKENNYGLPAGFTLDEEPKPQTEKPKINWNKEDKAVADANKNDGFLSRFGTGIKAAAARTALYGAGLGNDISNAVGGGNLVDPETLSVARGMSENLDKGTGVAGFIGNQAGDVLNFAPWAKLGKGALVGYGAAQGALRGQEGKGLSGRATEALQEGALAHIGGKALEKVGGAVLNPVVRAIATPLEKAGVKFRGTKISDAIDSSIASGFVKSMTKENIKSAPDISSKEIKDSLSPIYDEAKKIGAKFTPKVGDDFQATIDSMKPTPLANGKYGKEDLAFLDEIQTFEGMNGKAQSLEDIHKTISELGSAANKYVDIKGNFSPTGRNLLKLQSQLKNVIANPTEDMVTGSTKGLDLLRSANNQYNKQANLQTIELMKENAKLTDNFPSSMKSQLRNLVKNKPEFNRFTAEEQKAIRNGARTGLVDPILRITDSFMTPIIGVGVGGVSGAIAGQGVKLSARGIRNKITEGRTNAVMNTIIRRPDITPSQTSKYMGDKIEKVARRSKATAQDDLMKAEKTAPKGYAEYKASQDNVIVPPVVNPTVVPQSEMNVQKYVDDYLAGNAKDSKEHLQFAANNSNDIEKEFQKRFVAQNPVVETPIPEIDRTNEIRKNKVNYQVQGRVDANPNTDFLRRIRQIGLKKELPNSQKEFSGLKNANRGVDYSSELPDIKRIYKKDGMSIDANLMDTLNQEGYRTLDGKEFTEINELIDAINASSHGTKILNIHSLEKSPRVNDLAKQHDNYLKEVAKDRLEQELRDLGQLGKGKTLTMKEFEVLHKIQNGHYADPEIQDFQDIPF